MIFSWSFVEQLAVLLTPRPEALGVCSQVDGYPERRKGEWAHKQRWHLDLHTLR